MEDLGRQECRVDGLTIGAEVDEAADLVLELADVAGPGGVLEGAEGVDGDALAAIVGVLLAGAYACLADHFDHSLRSIEQAERYLGVPVVGSIGQQRRGLLV